MTDNETGTVRLQSIKDFVHVARDRNTVEGARIAAVRSIRLALSKEAAPPIQDAIDADAVPLLLQLTKTDNEELSVRYPRRGCVPISLTCSAQHSSRQGGAW